MRNNFVFAGIALAMLAGPLRGQATSQIACEAKMLRGSNAKEALKGLEYETFLNVAAAFGRDNTPRLYLVSGENAVYVAGSVHVDGRGKILLSRSFAKLMGNTLALKGAIAHEMAHLAVDVHGACNEWILRDPQVEMAADALAASKVGFGPVRAFLSRIEELTRTDNSEAAERLGALQKLEAQEKRQR